MESFGVPARTLQQLKELVQGTVVVGVVVEELLEVVGGRLVLVLAEHKVSKHHRSLVISDE